MTARGRCGALVVTVLLGHILYLCSPTAAVAAKTSNGTGAWSDPTMWSPSGSPGTSDSVTIRVGDTITVDIPTATASTTTINGTLSFSRSATSSLTLVGGNITVNSGGVLDMGTAASPIPSSEQANLILAYGSSGGQYGLVVNNGGALSVYGASKTLSIAATANAPAGATSVSVSATAGLGWSVGDTMTVDTEAVTISAINPNSINFSPALSLTHYSTTPVLLADLTRNVVVRSSGTDVTRNSAYVQNLTQNAANFSLVSGEFAYLGANINGEVGLYFGASSKGSISSSTIHNGYTGVSLNFCQGVTIFSNAIFGNAGSGITNGGVNGNHSVTFNQVYGNQGNGIGSSTLGNLVASNTIFLNASYGINFGGTGSQGSNSVISANTVYMNGADGIFMSDGGNDTIVGNTSYQNASNGFTWKSPNSLVISNSFFANGSNGMVTSNANRGTAVANLFYSNNADGVSSGNGSVTCVDCFFGYSQTGSAAPNKSADLAINSGNLTLKGSLVNPSPGLNVSGISSPGISLVSYDQDFDTGSIRVWGDAQVAANTLALAYASELYTSTATTPKIMRGTSISQAIVNTAYDANAVSQLITITYSATDSLWHISGSSSGALGTLAASGGTADFPPSSPQFNLTITASGSQDGDKADFALISASNDANFQKKLLFGSSASGFSGGRSRLTVAPSGGLQLTGTSASPTLVNMLGGGTYYTLIDSGAFTMSYSSISNTDSGGLQLSGSGGVAMSSSAFDFMGFTAATSAYITAANLASNATFYNLSFKLSRSTAGVPYAYNILVQPPDSSLSWSLPTFSGPFSGESYDSDPDSRVVWADTVPPRAITTFAASPGALDQQVNLSWTFPGDNGGTTPLNRGTWRIYYSTDPAAVASATTGQAQIQLSPVSAQVGQTVSYVASGLYAGTTFYFAMWAGDAAGNWSGLSNAATAQATDLVPPPPTNVAFSAAPGQITLTWTAPSVPDIDHYNVYRSSIIPYSVFQLLTSTPTTTFIDTGLTNNTTYVYRVSAVDYGNDPNRVGYVSIALESLQSGSLFAHTPDVIPPAAVNNLLASIGPSPGQVLLSWSAPGNDGSSGVLNTGSQFRVQYSTYGVSWSTVNAQVQISTANVAPGSAQSAIVSGLLTGTSIYFALWTADESGNWSDISNISTSMARAGAPSVVAVSPAGGAMGAAINTSIVVTFSAAMDPNTLGGAFSLTAIQDSQGNTINQLISGTTSSAGNQLTFSASLSSNTLYQVSVSTLAVDLQGNPLARTFSSQFTTLLGHTALNVVTSTAAGVIIDVPAGALSSDGYIQVSTLSVSANVNAATQKLLGNTGDRNRYPISGTIVDLKAYDTSALAQNTFNTPVTVSIPYPDADSNGIVDGTNPPVLASTLSVWWLDETNVSWIRLPSSIVDTAGKRVSAQTPHFTTFAIIGQSATDLGSAYVFPNPFRPNDGQTAITFAGLSQTATIKIYSVSGRLARTLTETDASGKLVWDATNDHGSALASGVYFYVIDSGAGRKTGKLAIIR